MNHSSIPKLSVSIITYNHEHYIAKAIDSVLMQKVDFDYEIIIGDDYSKDGTREILKSYQQKYPEIIQLILHPRDYDEIPGRTNNMTNLYACRGQYIAMLDGDDYWISEDKLQTQVNFLEENPEYVLSFHDANIFSDHDEFSPYLHSDMFTYLKEDCSFTHNEITSIWFIQTSSMVFKNNLIKKFPSWFWDIYSADYAIQLLVSRHGLVKYFKDILSARRKNKNSFSATNNQSLHHRRIRINEIKTFKKFFPVFKKQRTANEDLAKYYYKFAQDAIKLNKLFAFSQALALSIYFDKKYLSIVLKSLYKKASLKKSS